MTGQIRALRDGDDLTRGIVGLRCDAEHGQSGLACVLHRNWALSTQDRQRSKSIILFGFGQKSIGQIEAVLDIFRRVHERPPGSSAMSQGSGWVPSTSMCQRYGYVLRSENVQSQGGLFLQFSEQVMSCPNKQMPSVHTSISNGVKSPEISSGVLAIREMPAGRASKWGSRTIITARWRARGSLGRSSITRKKS